MMNNDEGDHNGFTKWSYGWLDDNNIIYIDKTSGDTTVHLTPIETELGNSKKIAVVTLQFNNTPRFNDEYFLVEYDSGTGNNADVFEKYALTPGFRIFHVNAKCDFSTDDDYIDDYIYYSKNNYEYRSNLIHNVKNELERTSLWESNDTMFFREGDTLTPDSYPNTGMEVNEIYNGLFTGISFTDFVTGDNPSFKVSFTEDYSEDTSVNFTLSYGELKSDVNMMLSADKPIIARNVGFETSPYLLDSNGQKFFLNLSNPDKSVYNYQLNYTGAYPSVLPNTEYTLVIPEGCFRIGYNKPVAEFRETIKTSDYFALTTISLTRTANDGLQTSNVFAVTDNIYGIIRVPQNSNKRCTFTEYNLNGQELSTIEFDKPTYGTADESATYLCKVFTLNDGNYALVLFTMENNYFVKIDRKGNILSDIFPFSDEMLNDYSTTIYHIDFDLYKDGLCKMIYSANSRSYSLLSIDFENSPQITPVEKFYTYYSIDSNTYIRRINDSTTHLLVYNSDDVCITDIEVETSNCLGVLSEEDNIIVMFSKYDRTNQKFLIYSNTYTKNGELLEHKELAEDTTQHIHFAFNQSKTTKGGYYLEFRISKKEERQILAYDKDWHYLGEFTFNMYTPVAFVGECGLVQKQDFLQDIGIVDTVSRFNIGDFEIVPKPEEHIESVSLNKTTITLGVGQSYTLKPTVTPENIDNAIFTWKSSDKEVATVTSKGKVTGRSVGTATITVKTDNGKTATCTVTVKPAPTNVSLNKEAVNIGVGQKYTLTATLTPSNAVTYCTWSSSDTSVATVTAGGIVTGKKSGTATITVKTTNGKTVTCKVNVKKAPSSITLDKTELTLKKGENYTLIKTLSPKNSVTSYKWVSSDETVVKVSSLGKVIAKKKGTATVTVTTHNGKTATCTVTVK